MILSINYADNKYKKHQKLNAFSAKYLAKVDKVITHGPEDIDFEFRNKHSELLDSPRGNGLWLWKPYFISKGLTSIQNNDYLVYTDSGTFYCKKISGLIQQMEKSEQDVMLFDLPLLEIQWSRKSIFSTLDIEIDSIKYSNQRNGAIIIIKKTGHSTKFVKTWLDLCTQPELLQPPLNTSNDEHFLFLEHREDQSILSLLSKKCQIESFSDPTDFGKLPYLYLSKSKLVSVPKYKAGFKINHTFFLHHRGSNIVIYFLKFLLRYYLMKIIDPMMKERMG